jgi:hypothetical protein
VTALTMERFLLARFCMVIPRFNPAISRYLRLSGDSSGKPGNPKLQDVRVWFQS